MIKLSSYFSYLIIIGTLMFVFKGNALQDSIASKSNPLQIKYNTADSLFKEKKLHTSEKTIQELVKQFDKDSNHLVQLKYKSFNLLGNLHLKLQNLDSSNYYFNTSLKYLKKTEYSNLKKQYALAEIKNSMALNCFNTGKIENSITILQDAIALLHEYINNSTNEDEKLKAIKKRLACIDNLAGFYRGVGDNKRAINLATYAYNEKQKILPSDDVALVISQLILGHLHLVARNYNKAGEFIDKGLEQIEKIPFAKSYAFMVRASIYENLNDFENAKIFYEKCEAIYRANSNGVYSNTFLDGIVEMSNFYTKINMPEKALSLAFEGYNYTQQKNYKNKLLSFYQVQNLALVHFGIKDYENAIKYSNQALSFFENQQLNMDGRLDSIQNETRKPISLFVRAKSEYSLKQKHTIHSLDSILKQTDIALKILEKKRTIIKTHADLETLLADNKVIIDFRKQLLLDLYTKTKNQNYLTQLLALHESSLYNRIRSRLNLKNVKFSDVPEKVIKRESYLKNQMSASLSGENASINTFFQSNKSWNNFLDSLKQEFPKYYNMRYATLEEPLDSLHKNLPKNTSVIRYIFINDTLYASVITKSEKGLYKLKSDKLSQHIATLSNLDINVNKTALALHALYENIWQPLETAITTKNVIIIPDGELFNLSFESLTPTKINGFKNLATKSLLAKYTISYNYSLLLLKEGNKTINYPKHFVAFAPEFNAKMKQDYSIKIDDSLHVDKTYISLLPQPFSVDLAKEYSRLFNGDYFINQNASKQIFKSEANEHKIIHIGTHAESNNVSPELSRLIFAKNTSEDDNSLYTFEIYNENLNSNLAILTACETGKPTYQPGEGMISLAHAFNYAGSESILTSLWKIDEKSSAEIIEYFYKHLKKGLPKNLALQQAKQEYLAKAEGRPLAPQYWAGLVLIGDINPIDLQTSNGSFWYYLLALFIIAAAYFILKK